jgi:hypothetical protein
MPGTGYFIWTCWLEAGFDLRFSIFYIWLLIARLSGFLIVASYKTLSALSLGELS